MSPASSHVVSLIPLQTQRWDPRRVWREGERQACGKGCSLTPLPPLSERPSLTPPSPTAPLATVWPLLCTLRVLSTSPSRYLSLLQPTTCMTGFSVSLPRRVWAPHRQALGLSCLPLYALTPGPGLWMLHKYLLTNSLSWSGQRWDLNPGMSDSQGSLGTQGPDHGEGLKDRPDHSLVFSSDLIPRVNPLPLHICVDSQQLPYCPGLSPPQEDHRADSGTRWCGKEHSSTPRCWAAICNLQSTSTHMTH